MSHEEDMKKVEEYLENKKQEKKSEYKLDLFEELEKKRQYQGSKKQKRIKRVFKSAKIFFIIIIAIIVAIVALIAVIYAQNMVTSSNVNIKKRVESEIGESVDCIYEDTGTLGNGLYIFSPKSNPEIQIHAIKRFGKYSTDSDASYHKYYFEKWEDEYKSNFIIEEEYKTSTLYPEETADGWCLSYKTYVEVETYDEFIEAVDAMYRFLQYINDSDSDTDSTTSLLIYMDIFVVYLGHNFYPITSYPSTYAQQKARLFEEYEEIVNL